MYAVVEISGKQQIVRPDEVLKVDRLNAESGDAVVLDKVLALGEGKEMNFGTPYLEGASVVVEVLENKKDKKVNVFKKKRRKRYEVKKGHRQHLSVVKVKEIKNSI
ncbi:MAG: 50S ribosomal protein L21 [Candidatus Delongbacteria bacterium]